MGDESRIAAKRKYEQSGRAESTERTRQRIVEATVGLHLTVGPNATSIAEVARRAGVQRVTVYSHFPDEASLLGACSAHWRALHPAPDPEGWVSATDPGARLRRGLTELYAWYRETEQMTSRVLRDAETMPHLRSVIENGLARYVERVRGLLAEPFVASAAHPQDVEAASRVAVDFHTWRSLEPLGDVDAAALAAGLVDLAARD